MKINYNKKNKYYQLKNISEVALLEEASHLKVIFKGVIVIALLIFSITIWSALVRVKETTTSYGHLIPEGKIQVVQHLEGGIIDKVFVDNGDYVKPNQVLLKVSTTQLTAELNQLRSYEVSLLLDSQRLNAFINDKPVDLNSWGKKVISSKYNPVAQESQISTLLKDQERLLNSQYEKMNDQISSLRNTISQREEKLKELKNQEGIWKTHMELLNQEFSMYKKLKENNYVSYKDYLTVLRAVNQSEGDGARISSEIKQTTEAVEESKNKLKEAVSLEKKEALEQLSKSNSELLEVRHKIEKLVDAINRSEVKSNIAGTIKGINVFAGNVIKSGDVLMEIVPEGELLKAESRLLPKEIGNINVGDPVQVKILTYDYSRYGSIEGSVASISASTFFDEENEPYYKAEIHLNRQFAGAKNNKKTLKAGMTVQADIITGQKTLLQYLLKPIHRSLTQSFHER